MKKVFKIVFLSVLFFLVLFFVPSNVKAADGDRIDFLVECKYHIEHGENKVFKDNKDSNNDFSIYYSSINDFGVYNYYSKTTTQCAHGCYNSVDTGYRAFATENTNTYFFSGITNGETSKPTNSFKTIYGASGNCPKYIITEYTSKSWGTTYHKVEFAEELTDNCKSKDAKCPFYASLKEKVREVIYYEGEKSWNHTMSGKDACDKLYIKMYIAGNSLKADYGHLPGSSYTSVDVKGEAVKNVNFSHIVKIANNEKFYLSVNPKDGGSGKQGVYFNDSTGTTFCYGTDGLTNFSKESTCEEYSTIENELKRKWTQAGGSVFKPENISDFREVFWWDNDHYRTDASGNFIPKSVTAANAKTLKERREIVLQYSNLYRGFASNAEKYLEYVKDIDRSKYCKDALIKIEEKLKENQEKIDLMNHIGKGLEEALRLYAEREKELGNSDQAEKDNEKAEQLAQTEESLDNLLGEVQRIYNNYASGANLANLDIAAGQGCGAIKPLISFLQTVLNWIRMIGIVMAVIMQIVDYIKVIFGSGDDSMVKANKHLTIRMIAVALLFLIPAILSFILSLFNIQGVGEAGTCGII